MPSMIDQTQSPNTPFLRREPGAGWVAGLYVLFGSGWVIVGEWLAAGIAHQPPEATHLQLLKGLVFVVGTGLLLFVLLRWRDRRRREALAPAGLLLGQIPGILWTTDRELRVATFLGSPVTAARLPQDLVGRRVTELSDDPEEQEAIRRGHRSALAGDTAEYRIRLGARSFVSRVEPLRDHNGSLAGCVGLALETTDLPGEQVPGVRSAFHQIRNMASLGSLVLAVAHQVKNPLFAMSSALDAFDQRIGHHPETERHRAILREQLERLVRLVTALQEYGQIGPPELVTTDLGPLIGRIGKDWQGRAARAGLALEIETPPPGALMARLDPEALSNALGALIANALEHTPRDGTVAITAGLSEDRMPVEISVHDSGPGFRPDDLDRLTRPLFSRKPGGSGLGLAVAERIVQLHGGRIEFGASPRGGARVTLRLPLHGIA